MLIIVKSGGNRTKQYVINSNIPNEIHAGDIGALENNLIIKSKGINSVGIIADNYNLDDNNIIINVSGISSVTYLVNIWQKIEFGITDRFDKNVTYNFGDKLYCNDDGLLTTEVLQPIHIGEVINPPRKISIPNYFGADLDYLDFGADFEQIISHYSVNIVSHKNNKSTNNKVSNGVYCKVCNTYNQYLTQGNQSDGSYICYSCKI